MVAPVAQQERDCEDLMRDVENNLAICRDDVDYYMRRTYECENPDAQDQ